MDSLVCWYDPGKQQCTNESMAANPVLTDLSGNGHDITCYNFAWSGMSGIGGGYFYDESNYEASSKYGTIKGNIIKITKWVKNVSAFHSRYVYGEKGKPLQLSIPAITIKVSGLPDGYNLDVNYLENRGNGIEYFSIKRDIVNGFTTLEAREINIEPNSENSTCYFRDMQFSMSGGKGTVSAPEDVDITIEILPLYPNALVSDGVDDYCYTDGLPILTDYTVIAKREYTNPSILYTRGNCFASKCTTSATTKGAFVIEVIEAVNSSSEFSNYSFGSHNITKQAFDSNNPYVYQTTNSYNGEKISKGTIQDTEDLFIFTVRSTETLRLGSIALYSFLLFDRTLTTAEIEWVKKNMIESGGVLKTDWSDSSLWSFRDGIHVVNDKRVEGTLSSNMMVITSCITTNNFMEVIIENVQTPAYNIKVTGLKNGITLQYKDESMATYLYFNEDGIYTIPAHNTNGRWYGFSFNKTFENENIVIQQLLS